MLSACAPLQVIYPTISQIKLGSRFYDPNYILLVDLLQREMGAKTPLRVVPLFETVADLRSAPTTLRQLFSIPYYHERVQGEQVTIQYNKPKYYSTKKIKNKK
jgi:phosphoenolpyruvate carboxylase